MKKQLINSLENAFEVLGTSPDFKLFDLLDIPHQDVQPLVAHYKLTKIVEASNKLNGWAADWSDRSQSKYFAYFGTEADATKPSGFGFSRAYYGLWSSSAGVGSRLTVGSSDEALHIANTFADLYETAFFIIKTTEA